MSESSGGGTPERPTTGLPSALTPTPGLPRDETLSDVLEVLRSPRYATPGGLAGEELRRAEREEAETLAQMIQEELDQMQ